LAIMQRFLGHAVDILVRSMDQILDVMVGGTNEPAMLMASRQRSLVRRLVGKMLLNVKELWKLGGTGWAVGGDFRAAGALDVSDLLQDQGNLNFHEKRITAAMKPNAASIRLPSTIECMKLKIN